MSGRSPEPDFALTRSILDAAVAARAFPAASIEVGRASGVLWTQAFGSLHYDDSSPAATTRTVFDLASLTKVVATTSLVMRLAAIGRLDLEAPIHTLLRGWRGDTGRSAIRVRHLLDHSSGLPAHARLWEQARGRGDYEAALRSLPLEALPGTRSAYSDVGFMLLGFILEDAAGRTLDTQMDALTGELGLGDIRYLPPVSWTARTAPTEFDSWRNRVLIGEVHDENAAALGGVAAQAGLFGTADAVGRFARAVLRAISGDDAAARAALPGFPVYAQRTGVPGSSRALGWDTMLPTSSCGTRLSQRAIGHTGFTGTSLWIDPEQDLYVVLLTNRVHPTRSNDAIRAVRPRVHDAVVADWERRALDA